MCLPTPPVEAEPERDLLASGSPPALTPTSAEAPRYLRWVLRVASCDPWAVAAALRRPGDEFFLWRDGRTRRAFAALGQVAQVIVPQQRERMAEARVQAEALAARTTELAAEGAAVADAAGLPLLVGGFAFAHCAPADPGAGGAPWRDWPGGRLVLPSVLLAEQERGQMVLVLSAGLENGDAPSSVHEHLQQTRAQIELAVEAANARAAAPTPLQRRATAPNAGAPSTPHDRLVPSPEVWLAQARRACQAIASGEVHKIVLARTAHWRAREGQHADLGVALRRLRRGYGDCTIYAIGRADGSVLFGASPETLVELRDGQVTTVALAGTGPRHGDLARDESAAQALAASVKERAEHRLVVGALKQALRPWCSELTLQAQPQVRKLRLLQHLETPLRGRLARPAHVLQLVAALHPTPAVAGWPTEAALGWLARHEGIDRGWYAGPIGFCDRRGEGHFVVALRCALLHEDQVWAFAGAGLTQRSSPPSEWEETQLKLRTIAEALAWTDTH